MGDIGIHVTDQQGQRHQVNAAPGDNLMEVLRDNVDVLMGICGGMLSCGTCLIRCEEKYSGTLPAVSDDEAEMLDALEAAQGCRLSCQIEIEPSLDGIELTLARED